MDPKRVLIVEPDTSFALSLATLFQDVGHRTALAADAAGAERDVAERPPDLVVLRAELPDGSGFAACPRLRRAGAPRPVPVIVISSDASEDALAEHARTSSAAD